MKIIEHDGRKYFQWDDSDTNARQEFESLINTTEAIDKIIDSLLRTLAARQVDSRKAWNAVRTLIKQIDPDAPEALRYNWILGAFSADK